jgi:hypothetical protein
MSDDPKPPSMDLILAGKLLESLARCSILPCTMFQVDAMSPSGVDKLTVLAMTEPVWNMVRELLASQQIEFPA